ncbi:branched-chain amino acid ABC transporter permease [Herbaspirillum lusitanum]|uniref:branched-chain amino acid ABC transporter permease n=1 Tax=Herbaspirillum lusitanum TaxID=213312 RepID=UPI00223761CD|nr:branched-chain amino acid ABC transporter permease [Herbaspirillum lusitanum]MCW5300374.1 branched-chain amino acid ABC transporter permease [Herbaspirillum lusitanum]
MSLFLDIVSSAAILYLVAAGLLMIFGVMKIINFAHGAFLTIGAYASLVVTQLGLSPWLALPAAMVTGWVFGMAIEYCIVRPLYARPLDAILATWGLGIVIAQVITLVFGREGQFVNSPLSGPLDVFGTDYSAYRLLLIVLAAILALAMSLLLTKTRFGLVTRAVIMNEELARGLGIHSGRVRFFTFSLGAALGCLAGTLITPLSGVDPNMGIPWLINAFMLVMVAGSSMFGLVAAALLFGGIQILLSTYVSPVLGGIAIVLLSAITLRIRPKGFSHD